MNERAGTSKPAGAEAELAKERTFGGFGVDLIEQQQIDDAFAHFEAFFALPAAVKEQWPLRTGANSGWEFRHAASCPHAATRRLPRPALLDGLLCPSRL